MRIATEAAVVLVLSIASVPDGKESGERKLSG